jgi:hypothetical protein
MPQKVHPGPVGTADLYTHLVGKDVLPGVPYKQNPALPLCRHLTNLAIPNYGQRILY